MLCSCDSGWNCSHLSTKRNSASSGSHCTFSHCIVSLSRIFSKNLKRSQFHLRMLLIKQQTFIALNIWLKYMLYSAIFRAMAGVYIKHSCRLKHDGCLREKLFWDCVNCEVNYQLLWFHFHLKEWLTRSMIIQAWTLGRDFLKNKQSEPITSRKTIFIVTNNKIWASKRKLDFGKSVFGLKLYWSELIWKLPIPNKFTDEISGHASKCDHLLLC